MILLPSLLVAFSGNGIPAVSATQPSLAGIKPLSGYKSIGAADPNMPVTVSVAIPLRNVSGLGSLVKQISDPNSPNYRHFLSSAQASQMFLPTARYQSVLTYLTDHGFTIGFTALNSTIVATGSVSQVKQYLGLDTQMFTNGTYSYYAGTGATSLTGAYAYASNSTFLMARPDYLKSASFGSGPLPASYNVTFTEGGQSTKLLQSVYNATSLYSRGITGKGYTVGLVDFYGSPTIASDLSTYDTKFGFAPPPSFAISPIGRYNPNLGGKLGWAFEIAIDVEVSHAMAPGANEVLYAANGALPLSSVIAAVIQDGRANVISQSFGIPEWEYQEAGPIPLLFEAIFPDYYYMLGSAEGISFLTSSGDAGGSGNSAGPIGASQYPSDSPFVTSVGGTTTYVSKSASGDVTFNQTAWSNLSSVPLLQNAGGSGGGVSIIEPQPWYQSSLSAPKGFPAGRMSPDIALDGSGDPGTFVVAGGETGASGGTSESSPLLAGLLTLIMQNQKGPLGLVNPSLYQLATNPATYTRAYDPITFGYTIPWVAKAGYNLATGWGAPNIGVMASIYGSSSLPTTLSVGVNIIPPKGQKGNVSEYFTGQTIDIVAPVTLKGAPVTTGSFSASVQTLQGASGSVPLTYDPTQKGWVGGVPVGNVAGIADVNVVGTSGTANGTGFAETFVGYVANFVQPLAPYPWTPIPGLGVSVGASDLAGNTPTSTKASMSIFSYSIASNTYSQVDTVALTLSSSGDYVGLIKGAYPNGPMALVMQAPVYGYLPIINGIDLQGSTIYPQLVVAPGVIAPGQSLIVVANMIAPENVYNEISSATGDTLGGSISYGANVTASLVGPSGTVVSTVPLLERTCAQALRVCANSALLIYGYLYVPKTAQPGLYTVMFNAAYNDETSGTLYTGSFYGQVYVASGASVPKITVSPSMLFEGQQSQVRASITYPSGKEITQGMYTAVIYPKSTSGQFTQVMHSQYASFLLIPLAFDPKQNLWTADVQLPSPNNSTVLSAINGAAAYYAGPYDIYVTGLSADGVPTTSDPTAQQDFFVQPYVYTANQAVANPQQTSGLALSNVTISGGPISMTGDYFTGTDTIQSTNVTISASQVAGTLNLVNTHATLIGVSGGTIVATNSDVKLVRSDLASLQLTMSTVSLDAASAFQSVTPSLPAVTIAAPLANKNYTGTVMVTASVGGTNLKGVTFTLDGNALPSGPAGGQPSSPTYSLDTTTLPDGPHTLSVVATQTDGLFSSSSVVFATQNQLLAVQGNLKAANSNIASLQGGLKAANNTIMTLNGALVNLKGQLDSANSTIGNLTDAIYALVVAAAVGIILAVYAIRKPRF